jgi:cyclic pyranopterin phosphate synthase
MSAKPELIDSFGRRIEYLRLSITDRCNYRCFYCMPASGVPHGQHRDFLRHEEFARLVRLFAGFGVRKLRLTGGEPLVRKGLVELVAMLHAIPGIEDLALSTNGHLLVRFAEALRRAGVNRVNISLDSLDADTFARITRGGDLDEVLRGIEAARAAGLDPVKLNMVVLRGVNDHEIEPMFDFARKRGVQLRFIETMPVGPSGRRGMDHSFYPAEEILERVRHHAGSALVPVKPKPGAGPARCYRVGAEATTVGVISAVSQHFCAGCNRVRLTARGELVLCLGRDDRVALGERLRAGASDAELRDEIVAAVARKPERHGFREPAGGAPVHMMSAVGG